MQLIKLTLALLILVGSCSAQLILKAAETQTVCIHGPLDIINPFTGQIAMHLGSESWSSICTQMRGRQHWFQQWPLGLQVANEYGEVITLYSFTPPMQGVCLTASGNWIECNVHNTLFRFPSEQ